MARRTEIDALRGLLLVLMALAHLPTRASVYVNQPLGFVSAAEGFVFLSAFLAGCTCCTMLAARGAQHARSHFSVRALKLYGYHVALLLFAFTIAAAFAALTGRPALRNLLSFYFDSPTVAIISGPLLLYQPPLFDILPMYIVFIALTPWLLEITAREGWRKVLTLSVLLWIFAQVGGRRLLYETLVPLTGVYFPMEAGGSFDMLAWQLLWVGGLWIGARYAARPIHPGVPLPTVGLAFAGAAAFLLWRHGIGAIWTDFERWYPALDKWHLGVLRILNFAALAVVVNYLVLPALAWLHFSVLSLLGRASLQVFCVHLLICVASLGLIVDDDTPLTLAQEILVLAVAAAAMVFVAKRTAAAAKLRHDLRVGHSH